MKKMRILSMLAMLTIVPIYSMDMDTDSDTPEKKEASVKKEKTAKEVATNALFVSCKGDIDPAMIEVLLQGGADVDILQNGVTPLMMIIDKNEEDTPDNQEPSNYTKKRNQALIMLAKKANEQHRKAAMVRATRQEHWQAYMILEELGATVDEDEIADGWDIFVEDSMHAARTKGGAALQAVQDAGTTAWGAISSWAASAKEYASSLGSSDDSSSSAPGYPPSRSRRSTKRHKQRAMSTVVIDDEDGVDAPKQLTQPLNAPVQDV